MTDHNIKRAITTTLALVALIPSGFFTVDTWGGDDTSGAKTSLSVLDMIENDLLKGVITLEEKTLLEVRAIRDPQSLPDSYKISTTFASSEIILSGRCATGALLEALRLAPTLSAGAQKELSQLMARPSKQFSYDSPGGNFKIHYNDTGLHAVSPIDSNSNGFPDYVERIAIYADSSWNKQIVEMNYAPPPSDGTNGGDSKIDIYLLEMDFYGYTQPEDSASEAWNDYTSYMACHRDFIGFPQNTDPEGNPAGAAKVTMAHEFQHVIQFGYDVFEELWFLEATATWMEEVVFDAVNDNYNYLLEYYDWPQKSLRDSSLHMYGSFVWPLYLEQRFDSDLMRKAWEGSKFGSAMTTLEGALPISHGVSRDDAIYEFFLWVYLANSRDDGAHFEEATVYPNLRTSKTWTSYPQVDKSSTTHPGGYGASLVRFDPNGNFGRLKISFDGIDAVKWGVWVVATRNSNQHSFISLSLDQNGFGTAFVDSMEVFDDITMIAVNLDLLSGASTFSYTAEVLDYAAISGTVVSDSTAYTLFPNKIGFRLTNLSSTPDSFDISASETRGWPLTADQIPTIHLAAGE
ncbi:MAG: hypothetical protein IIB00_10195, partial [candidate division Zixibacteria bacterium]|nr:hypothetical protein [candidate division Zixibacteria bacterium]